MRRRVLATLVSIFAVALLAAGLAASFFEDSGGYKISPEMKPAAPRAPDPAQTEAKVPNQQAAAQQTAPRAMPPAVTPARFKFRPDEPALVAEGKRLYGVHCASCHGVKLEGQPNWKQRNEDGKLPAPPHDASGHTWHHPEGMLFALTKFGPSRISGAPSAMPAYAEVLTDEQIIATLSFIKSTWSPEIRQRHDQMGKK
ncbi:MAG: cytochrome c [Proteobacteria bacterium]|nr:cytochrome c [Pseudomonadota bacterium]